MSKPKLFYFANRRGEAEAIRMMFKEARLDFEDVPVDEDTFAKMDQAGDLLFGQLPMMQWGDLKLTEAPAIIEHIAANSKPDSTGNKLLGANENERSTARSLCSAARDIRRELLEVLRADNKEAKAEFKKTRIPFWFEALNRLAVASGDEDRGLGAGVNFTFGDLAVFEAINAIGEAFMVSALRTYPSLKEWHDKAIRRPALEKHIQTRPAAEW